MTSLRSPPQMTLGAQKYLPDKPRDLKHAIKSETFSFYLWRFFCVRCEQKPLKSSFPFRCFYFERIQICTFEVELFSRQADGLWWKQVFVRIVLTDGLLSQKQKTKNWSRSKRFENLKQNFYRLRLRFSLLVLTQSGGKDFLSFCPVKVHSVWKLFFFSNFEDEQGLKYFSFWPKSMTYFLFLQDTCQKTKKVLKSWFRNLLLQHSFRAQKSGAFSYKKSPWNSTAGPHHHTTTTNSEEGV